jgi:NAD-dependent SIR2 family protein deacetylase
MLSFDTPETAHTHALPPPPPQSQSPPQSQPPQQQQQQPQPQPHMAVGASDEDREAVGQRLRQVQFLPHDNPLFFHGRAFWAEDEAGQPEATWRSDERPRDDHDAVDWLTATEFADMPAVAQRKVELLAQLLRLSRKTVIYSGAGVSVAAHVGQAARGSGGGQRSTDAQPTFTHLAAGVLAEAGLLHGWVQQNHDGLPQKGGFPQESINEIHGSWYDPANPVVKYSGSLHDEAYPWMIDDAETADLVLVMGTSLGGLNADQMATKPAERSLHGGALGTVIINLQQTEQDGKASLRMFGKTDDLMRMLLRELGLREPPMAMPRWPAANRVAVPYDGNGARIDDDLGIQMWLDMSDGQQVKITPGHNIQGAQQPPFMHIGASKDTVYRGQRRPPAEGYGSVVGRDDATSSFNLSIEGAWMRLGIWWLEAAARGGPKTLPIVNAKPEFEASRDQLDRLDQRLQQAAERASKDQCPVGLLAEFRRLADRKAMIEPYGAVSAVAVHVPETDVDSVVVTDADMEDPELAAELAALMGGDSLAPPA